MDLSNQKLWDFQKTIINQSLAKVSEIKNEMIKIWEPINPLVIDYEGNGTELSDAKMSFDLDSDGKNEISIF